MDYDPEKFRQIIVNLLSNAIKFTPEYGKITLSANVVDDQSSNQWLEIKAEDTGIGISAEKLPFIFDRFYQADDSSVRKGEGTGLGLALVKELTELMGGSIRVESELEKGTRFTLRLPVQHEAIQESIEFDSRKPFYSGENIAQTITPKPQRNPDTDAPIVLLVEDNKDVIYYLRNCLEGLYQIHEASNGRLGIDKALKIVPDLIISDVMMPEVDGFELCRTLKTDERTSHIPIIMLTARASQTDKMEGLTHGADVYLAKPFQKEELLLRLDNLLNLRDQIQKKIQDTQTHPDTVEDVFLQKVRAEIATQIEDPDFGVMPLSEAMGMSRVQVHRKLKALMGLSTTQFIRRIRMEKALGLLKETDLTISEIGYSVGFKDPAHFSRAFSQHFGAAPREMRK